MPREMGHKINIKVNARLALLSGIVPIRKCRYVHYTALQCERSETSNISRLNGVINRYLFSLNHRNKWPFSLSDSRSAQNVLIGYEEGVITFVMQNIWKSYVFRRGVLGGSKRRRSKRFDSGEMRYGNQSNMHPSPTGALTRNYSQVRRYRNLAGRHFRGNEGKYQMKLSFFETLFNPTIFLIFR